MAKGVNPFAGKRAPPFEKPGRDVEPKGVREGSPRDMALDKRQSRMPPPMPPPMSPMAMKKGGRAKRGR